MNKYEDGKWVQLKSNCIKAELARIKYERDVVTVLRTSGESWTTVGEYFNISRQGAEKRFGHLFETTITRKKDNK